MGVIEGYVIEEQLNMLMEEKNISLNIRYYQSQKELDQALENKEIDLLAANAHAIHDEWKIIDKFSYAPFYFAANRDNENLTHEISEAIIRISIHEPEFDDNLIMKYFPRLVNSPYNKEEMECIEKGRVYNVYFDSGTAPLIWYDEKTNSMQGTLFDVCSQLEKLTGLKLELTHRAGGEDIKDDAAVNYRMLYYQSQENESDEKGVTDSILNQSFEMYHKVGDTYKTSGNYRIAVVKNRGAVKQYLGEKYSGSTIVEYDTPAECMTALDKGTADLTFLDKNVAENVTITDNLDGVTAIPMTEIIFGIALQFYGEDAENLAGIVDKGIRLIDENIINEAMIDYALSTKPEITLAYLIAQHTGLFVICIIVLVLILLAFSILITYAQVMKKQRNHIEEVDRERSDFFARMSHDMRTPMNGILGMIELSLRTGDMEEIQENMIKAKASGQYMLSLINDTLDLQRLEEKKMQFNLQIVQIESFIEDLDEMVRGSASQKGIDFEIKQMNMESAVFVRFDPVHVKQIFANLISNAIKFTPQGGKILVVMEHLGREENREKYKFQVQDSGIGMGREFLKGKIYKAYAQEENGVSGQYAGSGLGLAIAKNLVELMGGILRVESEPGEGSIFTFFLDFESVEEQEARQNIEQQKDLATQEYTRLKGKRILLCEDHMLNAEIAEKLLEKAGCEVVWTENGKKGVEAFEAAREGFFDAVLMDIRMPVMNGIEAAKAIRGIKRSDASTIPIIAMTANAYEEDKRQSTEAGMNAHLAKPIEPGLLYAALGRFIE